MIKYCAFVAIVFWASQGSALQPVENGQQDTVTISEQDTIVVTGKRQEVEKSARSLARRVTIRPTGQKAMPRFSDPICVAIIGLGDDHSTVFKQRMYQNIEAASLRTAGEDCQPNVVVVFTTDINSTLLDLKKKESWLFSGLPNSQFKRLANENGGSRAWRNTVPGDRFGNKLQKSPFVRGLPGLLPVETYENPESGSGRIQAKASVLVKGSIVLFDRAKALDCTIGQLADFATMRALLPVTETPEDSIPAEETILSLFSEAGGPEGLSEFDRAFLSTYYMSNAWTFRYASTLSLVADRYADTIESLTTGEVDK